MSNHSVNELIAKIDVAPASRNAPRQWLSWVSHSSRVKDYTKASRKAARTALIAICMALMSSASAWACRTEKGAIVPNLTYKNITKSSEGKYGLTLPKGVATSFELFKSKYLALDYCVDIKNGDIGDYKNTLTGVVFWEVSDQDKFSTYRLYIRRNQYWIVRRLYDKDYELIPLTTENSIRSGIGQSNEILLRLRADGADIVINGVEVNKIVARPSSAEMIYGVAFQAPDSGEASFQFDAQQVLK